MHRTSGCTLEFDGDLCSYYWRRNVARQAKYLYSNSEERSRNHCCSGKAVITPSECVCVALVTQHARHVRLLYYHLSLASLYPTHFILVISQTTLSGEKKLLSTNVFELLQTFVSNISHVKKNLARYNCT